MCSSLRIGRASAATAISLWLAMFACLMGCTQPLLADSGSSKSPVTAEKSISEDAPDEMAGMENCPHSSHHNTEPDGKQTPASSIACCPLEISVAPKPEITHQIVVVSDLVPTSSFDLVVSRIYFSEEFVPVVYHTGRDTLLETHLLRI